MDLQAHPPFSPRAINKLLQNVEIAGLQDATVVVLVGAGDGQGDDFLRALRERDEEYRIKILRCSASGVDPVMVDLEDWGDVLLVPQVFHLYATKEALEELHKSLHPGATFGMLWRVEDYNLPPDTSRPVASWCQEISDLLASHALTNAFRYEQWREVFEAQKESNPLQTIIDTLTHNFASFSLPLGEEKLEWQDVVQIEKMVGRILQQLGESGSKSKDLDVLENKVREILTQAAANSGNQGSVLVKGLEILVWTSRV